MPLAGHHAALIRDLMISLAVTHDVLLLDWLDPRDVPKSCGSFGFEDQIQDISAAIQDLPMPGAHVVGICQSGLPTLTAAAALACDGTGGQIQSLTLMGAPFDPRSHPTNLSRVLGSTARGWIELFDIITLGPNCLGQGRRVYPAASQLKRIQGYLQRIAKFDNPVRRKLWNDDGLDAEQYPFLKSLTDLKDIPAEAFLDNIDRSYHHEFGSDDWLSLHGRKLPASYLSEFPILTIEGREDDIVAPGQTSAIHGLLPRSAGVVRQESVVADAGHFDLFHGRICRSIVVPQMLSFFDEVSASVAA
ncbi:MAG: hypothetical protein AAFV45_00935 [Pseudomonadota bacterium]